MRKGFVALPAIICLIGITTSALAGGSATREEVVQKCKQAATLIKEKRIDAAIKRT